MSLSGSWVQWVLVIWLADRATLHSRTSSVLPFNGCEEERHTSHVDDGTSKGWQWQRLCMP